jgi:hypothetical protein
MWGRNDHPSSRHQAPADLRSSPATSHRPIRRVGRGRWRAPPVLAATKPPRYRNRIQTAPVCEACTTLQAHHEAPEPEADSHSALAGMWWPMTRQADAGMQFIAELNKLSFPQYVDAFK